ncbi:hypothetical protein [Hyalangium rubrum]|uniref:Lipoprotein n=1 Tax=Hyalangium rubrum TaxID=3103134 RepID=A0ABU5H9T7_9BACT|nr:hypothetical protein [Hyalangium sp. s54d21]MDY7230085.1 hypothetical protein [Hyalangium sp. s54d21]
MDRVLPGTSAAAFEEATGGPAGSEGGLPATLPETLVSEDLQDTYVLLLNAGSTAGVSWVKEVPPACYLETTVTVAAELRAGALPPLDLREPMTLPEGSTLRWEVSGTERPGEQGKLHEVSRLGAQTLRVTTTSTAGQVEDPFAGLEPLGNAGGGNTLMPLERSLGRTADLELSRPGALEAYGHFVATGEVPLAEPERGVLRSGRVAVFTQQRSPGAELGFLRQFRRLDAERVVNAQWSAEYDDGSVEVRSSARFTGRMVLWYVVIDSTGQQTRGDLSVVFSHLTPATVAALAKGLRGEAEGLEGRWHVELRLADQEVMLWRNLARMRVCERNNLDPAQFEREARTSAMELWEGDVGLQTLALARSPDEVGDMLVRLGNTAELAAQSLAQLMLSLGAPLEGTLRLAPAQSS